MKMKQITSSYYSGQLHTGTVELTLLPEDEKQELYLLNIYPQAEYQTIGFFGGAITDAVGATLESMPAEKAKEVIEAYFGSEGIGYSAIRVPIDSCDFSTEQYSADSDGSDEELSAFSICRDEKRIIPWILSAYAAAGKALPVTLSPWSPPAYMKTNGKREGGKLEKRYYSRWACYLCKYIRAYREHGINVTALSLQNEPNAVQTWDSCVYSAEEERDFLCQHLYPQLMREGLGDIEIYVWDHNKERLFDRAEAIIDSVSSPMIAGLAFHWYSGDHFDALRLVREKFPDKTLTFSEGCIEYSRHNTNQLLNAQIYGHDMLGNLSCGMNNFYDWNLCLNEQGGPNYAGNYCEAPIIFDSSKGTLEYKLSFAYIAHFSKYVASGAKHIATTSYTDRLENVAFKNADGSIAAIMLNRSEQSIPVVIRVNGRLCRTELAGSSIATVILS